MVLNLKKISITNSKEVKIRSTRDPLNLEKIKMTGRLIAMMIRLIAFTIILLRKVRASLSHLMLSMRKLKSKLL